MPPTPEPPEFNPYHAPESSGHVDPPPRRRGLRKEIVGIAIGVGLYLGIAAFFITCRLWLNVTESPNDAGTFLMLFVSSVVGVATFCGAVWGILKANPKKEYDTPTPESPDINPYGAPESPEQADLRRRRRRHKSVEVAVILGLAVACFGFFGTCVGVVISMPNGSTMLLVLLASSVTTIAACGFTIWGVLKFYETKE